MAKYGFIIIVAVCVLAQGCSTLPNSTSISEAETAAAVASGQFYTVRMETNGGQAQVVQQPIEGAMTLQDALLQSGATKKFRNMQVDLYRTNSNTGDSIKMAIEYEPKTKSVPVEQDYALHPGDRILVRPRETKPLDEFMKAFGGA